MSKKLLKSPPTGEKVAPIRLLILDVDGVLTDGSIIYGSSGEELKAFNVKDGAGLKYWRRVGHATGIITGRESSMVLRRAKELDIQYVEMNAKNKAPALERLLAAAGVKPEEAAMVGDDLPDIPIMRRVGLAVAVRDAVLEVREAADMVTEKKGGKGAVREVIEYILKAQGRWEGIMERYL